MEKLSQDAIPGLIICDSGYVTRLSPLEEIEELEEKERGKQTTALKPELIRSDAGTITRVDGKPIKV